MRGLTGRNFLVTGAASGIGRATAQRLAAEGAGVAVLDIDEEGAVRTAEGIAADGGRALAAKLDVTERTDWERTIEHVVSTWGGVAGLVNNAGVTRDRTLLNLTDADWELVLDVNLRGAWLGCQHVVPHLRREGGSIVNLSSESRWGEFGQANYAAAKSGLVGLTRTVALEHGRHGIRVNAVAPGVTTTPMVEAVPSDIRASWLPNIPLQREADPPEIAAAIAFLLSSDASYVTGQILGVNGGSAL